MKKAYLVDFNFMVRVVAGEDATNMELIKLAAAKLRAEVTENPIGDNAGEIFEDTEDPYDPEND